MFKGVFVWVTPTQISKFDILERDNVGWLINSLGPQLGQNQKWLISQKQILKSSSTLSANPSDAHNWLRLPGTFKSMQASWPIKRLSSSCLGTQFVKLSGYLEDSCLLVWDSKPSGNGSHLSRSSSDGFIRPDDVAILPTRFRRQLDVDVVDFVADADAASEQKFNIFSEKLEGLLNYGR